MNEIIIRHVLALAFKAAKKSRCIKRQVGAVVTNDNNIGFFYGYNKSAGNIASCSTYFSNSKTTDVISTKEQSNKVIRATSLTNKINHSDFHDRYEIHAEESALLDYVASKGTAYGATLFCTLQPCWHCTKIAVELGIKRLVYSEQYIQNSDEQADWLNFLKLNNVEVIQIDRKDLFLE